MKNALLRVARSFVCLVVCLFVCFCFFQEKINETTYQKVVRPSDGQQFELGPPFDGQEPVLVVVVEHGVHQRLAGGHHVAVHRIADRRVSRNGGR